MATTPRGFGSTGKRSNLGPHYSDGAKRLRAELSDRKQSITDAAKALGTDDSVVCRWLYGDRLPSIRFARVVEQVYGVPMAAWSDAPKGRPLRAMKPAAKPEAAS